MKQRLFLVTSNCNLDCSYCNLNIDSKAFMSLDKFDRLLDECEPEKDYIILSGGEPTLHPEISYMLARINNRGFKGQIITNGYKILEQITLLEDIQVNLSLASMYFQDEKDRSVFKVLGILEKHDINICISAFYNNYQDSVDVMNYVFEKGWALTFNMPTQINFKQELANYHVPVKFDPVDAYEFYKKYKKLYKNILREGEWFIHHETIFEHIDLYNKQIFWYCTKEDNDNIDVYYPKAPRSHCCTTKTDPSKCLGCISTCDLEISRRRKIGE